MKGVIGPKDSCQATLLDSGGSFTIEQGTVSFSSMKDSMPGIMAWPPEISTESTAMPSGWEM